MAYTPTNWKSGDVVTSEKLNKVEKGLASAVMTINATTYSETVTGSSGSHTGVDVTVAHVRMDKTAGEVYEAFRSGTRCLLIFPEGTEMPDASMTYTAVLPIISAALFTPTDAEGSMYVFCAQDVVYVDKMMFYSASADEYPTTEEPAPSA